MASSSLPTAPQLVSMRTLASEGAATYDWHSHPFEEFTLVTDDECMIGYPPGWRKTAPATLLHYHRGEQHGAWVSPNQRPRFWVIHFTADNAIYPALSNLRAADPAKRVWALSPEHLDTFQWLFLQLLNEHTAAREYREQAASAWLQLLLITVNRWAEKKGTQAIVAPSRANSEVLKLWHLVNEAVTNPDADLYASPNYDSVRHAFRATFGYSPRAMLQRLRMEHAKNLLLETSLSIKEIAGRVGYFQQHDFNRMFHRHTGMAPSKWRANPLARSTSA